MTHRLMACILAQALIFLLSNGVLAQPGTWPPPWYSHARCTRHDADKAEYEADALKSWAAVYRAFERYGQCDDGAIAEGYSASVATLLADRWSSVRALPELTKKDPMFERFVLWHVDETMSMEQGNAIRANVRNHCPSGLEALCKRLEKAAADPK